VNFGYERDIILLNRLFARAAFNFGAFNITAGLAAGFLNFDSTAIGLAFSTALSAQSPNGRIFGALGLDLPFDGAQEDSSFPYEQTCFTIDTGVRLPSMVMSFRALLSVVFLRDVKEVYDIRYSTSKQTLYALTAKTDLVGRWNFSLTAGYRDVSRSVRALFLSEPYHYPSFFTCLGVFLRVNHDLELSVKADVPFYPWVFTPLPDQSDAFLFMASLGFTLRFGKP
ncbi:MAG: hypothetical protein LBG05_08335, partial [Treponema sp.]|jgi:hypothetical protein|nr:hypothetical protein [Treponema sp.]